MNTLIDHDILEQCINLRHELHQHPELSMQETWTKLYLMDYLKAHTHLQLVDRDNWFYAVYENSDSQRHIAFRADFDAVPVNEPASLVSYHSLNEGAAHKCGHDGHSSALVALALMLERYGAPCNVYLLFQHAEETGQGAKECLPILTDHPIEEIYAVHNMPGHKLGAVAVAEGVVQYASTGMTIRFEGQRCHACYPEDGRNPAYAISEIVMGLEQLRASMHPEGLTLITVIGIQVGDRTFGTSAGEGQLMLTVRGEHEEELQELLKGIEQLADQKAHLYGLKWSVSYEDEFADCFNHPQAVETVRNAAKNAGVELQDLKEPFRASEDFGRFTKVVPGAIFYVGSGEDHPALHTPDYDFPDSILPVITRMYLEIIQVFAFGEKWRI